MNTEPVIIYFLFIWSIFSCGAKMTVCEMIRIIISGHRRAFWCVVFFAVDYSGVMYCNTVNKPGLCRHAWMRLLLLSQRHRGSATGQTQMWHWTNIPLTPSAVSCPWMSVWAFVLLGKATHGPPCERAGPPVCDPDHRPGSAASQPGKGEYHRRRCLFIYSEISFWK